MKKNFRLLRFVIIYSAIIFNVNSSSAQIIRLSTGFDNYIGSVATVPAGWHISWNSTSSPSYYITAGNYGAAIPSYKFGITQDTIFSPHFLSGDTLKFWCKGQGTFSVQNVLSIYISEDSLSWNQIQNLDSLPVTATTFSFPLPCSAHYLMFVYFQVSGSLAFDDVKVTMTDYFPVAFISTWINLACAGDSICFGDLSTIAGCDSIVSRIWDFGDSTATDSSQNPCHVFPFPGNYNVRLYVTASNGNADSTMLQVTIFPLPVAQFIYNNVSGTLVDLTDMSTIYSDSIVSWYWSFGDSTFSIQHNPSHFYPSVGMYFTCLTVTSGSGCMNTFCDSLNVVGVGIDEYDLASDISVSPNPAINQLAVSSKQLAVTQIDIHDILGQRIFSQQPAASSQRQVVLDISHLNSGIYFLKLKAGKHLLSRKFIIQK
ncbi:MAG TPA: PKD domain-containing protein [Bacteroidia bacterium]|nr:PKD domain-containing protein [Bacteroidia bacterium]